MSKKKTHNEFVEELKQKNIDVAPLEEYKSANTKILFKCNKCGYVWSVTPSNLFRNKKCQKCNGRERYTNKTFLDKLHAITNTIEPLEEYVSTHTKILCKCKICKNEWRVSPSKLFLKKGCPECAKKTSGNKGKYKYSESYIKNILHNKNISILDEYKGIHNKNNFMCLKCEYKFTTKISHILYEGTGCKNCANISLRLSHDEFVNRVKEKLPELEILSKYNGSSKRVTYKCKTCGLIHSAFANNLLKGYGCPSCCASKGEKICKKYLEDNNINYIPQFEFDDLVGVNNGNLKFDFAILNNSNDVCCLLEYDGIFHYEKQYFDDGFENLQIHDNKKNEYCKNKDIPLIRIPYWEFDNIENILDNYFNNNDLTCVINKDNQTTNSLLLCSDE